MMFRSTNISSGVKYLVEEYQNDFPENSELKKRLRKTLYFGRKSNLEQPSLAMTEFAVDMLQNIAPKELGRIDIDWAACMSGELMVSPNAYLVGMIYTKRLQKKQTKYIHQISSSDLFLVSMMMASKFLYDEGEEDGVDNNEWATSVNMDVKDLNELERNFLAALDWDLFVSEQEFWTTLLVLEQQLARRKLQECRSLTYTEVLVLTATDVVQQPICQLLVELCKVVAVCTMAYAASTVLLVSSQLTLYASVSSVMGLNSFQHLEQCAVQPAFKFDIVNPLPLLHDHGAVVTPSFVNNVSKLAERSDFNRERLCIEDAAYIGFYVHIVLSTITPVFCLKPRRCLHAEMETQSGVNTSKALLNNNTIQGQTICSSLGRSTFTCPFLSPTYVLSLKTPSGLMRQNLTEFGVIL